MSKEILGQRRSQLRKLAKQLKAMLAETGGEFSEAALALMRRIRLLIHEIRGLISQRELSRILGAAAVFFGLGVHNQANAQSFASAVPDPFGIQKNSYLNIPTLVDIDGDGDQDMFAGVIDASGYYNLSAGVQFHENTGTPQSPQFAAPVTDTFNIDVTPMVTYIVFPTFGDLDGDGDYDMLAGGSYNGLFYFENTGTAQSPNFAAPLANPFGLSDSIYYGSPVLLDLDNDGDLDLLGGEYDGRIVYYENTGTATQPAFGVKQYEPFGLQSLYYAFPSVGDVDQDGDLDLIVGDYNGDKHYFENTGTVTNPQFAAPVANPSNLQAAGSLSFVAMADMDGDSDPDLLEGAGTFYSGVTMAYYENLQTGVSLEELAAGIDVFPNVVRDQFSIETNLEINAIRLVDMSGKQLRSWSSDLRVFDIAELQPGTYLLELTTGSQTIQKKLLKD